MDLFQLIESYEPDMLATLEEIVNIDSGADSPEGIKLVAEKIGDKLKETGFEVEYQDYPNISTNILARKKGTDPNAKEVMIIGHMDTVFPKGTAQARPFKIENGLAYGPGVLDMKSGVIIATYALKAMEKMDMFKHNVTVLFCGDEESGHGNTNTIDIYLKEGANKDAVFNMETGSDSGTVVLGRSGLLYPEITVDGIASHSGKDPEKGASAVKELIFKLVDLYNISDADDDISFNAGIITGGVAPNGIAAFAQMRGDFRFKTIAGSERAYQALRDVCGKTYVNRTKTTLVADRSRSFMPMEKTEKNVGLYEIVKKQGEKIGVDIDGIIVGGGSDSCWTTIAGAPTVCAMGGRGELNHSAQEYLQVYSLIERAKILALSIDAL